MSTIQDLLQKMTLKEKISITSGFDTWRLKGFQTLGIPKITVCDGPHGLRHQEEGQDHLGINESNPSTCFPPACLSAASFDEELLFEMGQAIGFEALCQNVQVVLGPGVNIKRNPLCGRNFEYFSEDPVLAGKMAAGWIKGVQSMGVGTSLKHFALNSQELNRMKSDSIADEKAKFDIYLKAFEIPLKTAEPMTVMGSYNLVDGIYASENKWLMEEVLRNKYGFQGLLMTDWGAMNDKISSMKAGLDLEMPGSLGYFDEEVEEAIKDGRLPEAFLDTAVRRILQLITTVTEERQKALASVGPLVKSSVDIEKHHGLAKKIAMESMILLKNDRKTLPVSENMDRTIYLVGALSKYPRYQGAGSSHINPYKVTSLLESLEKESLKMQYFEGYSLESDEIPDETEELLQTLKKEDVVIIAAGLPDSYESEGFDRKHMRLPENQNVLIRSIAAKSDHVVVVLFGGSPVEMPWLDDVSSLLHAYLPGQAGGEAVADLLLGRHNPSGKLPETYPVRYEDHITSPYYGKDPYLAPYLEGIYVGYRYFDKANRRVQFPFGYGLSYTTFSFSRLSINRSSFDFKKDKAVEVRFYVKNTGDMTGKEVCQLYLARKGSPSYRVEKALKAFCKIKLEPGEEKEIVMELQEEAFKEFDLNLKKEVLYGGEYILYVGSSSQDLPLSASLEIKSSVLDTFKAPAFYTDVKGAPEPEQFETLIGRKLPVKELTRPFTVNHTLEEMKDVPQMKYLIRKLEGVLRKASGVSSDNDDAYRVMHAMFMQTPIKRLSLVAPDKMPKHLGETLVHVANGRYLRGLQSALKRKAPMGHP